MEQFDGSLYWIRTLLRKIILELATTHFESAFLALLPFQLVRVT